MPVICKKDENGRYNFRGFFSDVRIMLLVSAILLGNVFGIKQLSIFGVVPTYYRAVIVLLALYYLCRRLLLKKAEVRFSRLFWVVMGMMSFWIAYASIQLITIQGLDIREGLKEIMSLGLGLLSIYCIYEAISSESALRFFVKSVRIIVAALLILAFFEITTGIHFPTSRYCDPNYLKSAEYIARFGTGTRAWHTATGLAYNQNDFLFLLTLASPFFFPNPAVRTAEKIRCYIGLSLMLCISVIDGGFITTVAIVLGMLMYLILTKASFKKHIVIWTGAFLIQRFIAGWINRLLLFDYFLSSSKVNTEMLGEVQALDDALIMQIGNANTGQGSLYYRITIYRDSLKAFIQSKWLGLGPGGFGQYFTAYPSESGLTNPHFWILEILVQYGVFVLAAYAMVFIMTFIKSIKMYLKTKKTEFAIAASMLVVFVFGCFAPSSMMGLPYIWLPLVLCIVLLNLYGNDKEAGEHPSKV